MKYRLLKKGEIIKPGDERRHSIGTLTHPEYMWLLVQEMIGQTYEGYPANIVMVRRMVDPGQGVGR